MERSLAGDRMKIFKFVKRDFRLGIWNRLFLFVLPLLIAGLQTRACSQIIWYLNADNIMQTQGSVMDYILYCTQGMAVFHFSPTEYFIIPVYWFLFQIYVSYLVVYYASDDFTANAQNLVIASGRRKSWWDAKCIWGISTVLLYFGVYYAGIILWAKKWGAAMELHYTQSFLEQIAGMTVPELSTADVFVMALIVPLLITTGLCLAQIFMGFIMTPIVSFAVICGIYVLSAYYTVWWLPGSFSMWLRSSMMTQEGVNPVSGMLFSVLLIYGSWHMGRVYFETKDILK